MSVAPRFERYRWSGGEEWMMRFGPADGPQVVAALPLFEEANRTRAFVVMILRLLAERGIGGALPELPGQGESLVATNDMRLQDLRNAFAAALRHVRVAAPAEAQSSASEHGSPFRREKCAVAPPFAVRSGALLVSAPAWLLSPQEGPSLLRELARLTAPDGSIAGHRIDPAFLTDLADAQPAKGDARIVRLTGDPRPADRVIDAAPLWRRAEPDNDLTLAQTLTDDIADWIATCAAR